MKRNKRRFDRIPSSGPITLIWADPSGRRTTLKAKILDQSATGLRIEVGAAIPLRSYVTFKAAELNSGDWAGWGSVRYCRQSKTKYVVGLELSAGLRWNPGSIAPQAPTA